MPDSPTDKLIRDAYSVVAKPDRLLQLLSHLQSGSDGEDSAMDSLEGHFDRVVDLLDEIDSSIGDDFTGFTPAESGGLAMSRSAEAQLTLDDSLRITAIDPTMSPSWGGAAGKHLPSWVWELEPEGLKKLKSAICNGETEAPILVRLRTDKEDENGLLCVATIREVPERSADLRAIRLRWNEKSGALFANVLKLTDAETQLAQYIVDGLSVRQFSMSRGRSVGTARNQLKTLLRKLGLGSQLDLVSLYGGFHASFMAAQFQDGESDQVETGQVFHASCGGILPYEVHGKQDGIPLLYLHATVDGALLSPRQTAAARANGFRVIAPWLPFYAGSTVPKLGLPAVDIYAERILELLEHLGIKSCPIVTVRVSAPYGFALLNKAPEAFDGLVTAGAILPSRSADDFSHLAMGYRAPMRLARIAPGFVKLYFAAAAAMVRKGTSDKFFKSLYGDSPADLATLDDPDVVEVMRRAMQRTFQDGYDGPVQQALLSASDWSHFCADLSKPVIMVCGSEDGLAPPEKQQAFCAEHDFELVGPLDNVGSLAMHQVPRLVFDSARKLCEGR